MSTEPHAGPRVDVVCLGETMGQFVPAAGGIVAAESFTLEHAGAESNVAVGLARLGLGTAWVSRLGDDAVGQRILNALTDEGVDTSLVERDSAHPTGIFLKEPSGHGRSVTYYRRGSAASTMDRDDVDRALAARAALLHISGITSALSASCDDAVQYALTAARQQGVTTSFDVNYRPVLWASRDGAARRLAELANLADIVFVGQDEATDLWGADSPHSIAHRLAGAGRVIVKDGDKCATSLSEGTYVIVPALRVQVAESVGAGDAFAAGWLAAMLNDRDEATRLRCGHLMARASLGSTTDHGARIPLPALLADAADESLWRIPHSNDLTPEDPRHAPR